MAVVKLPQNSFANGIIKEDRLRGRYDLKQYEAGVREAHNVNLHPQGGLYRRFGSLYLASYTSKLVAGKVRFSVFDYSDDIEYLLVFYDDKIDIWRESVLVHTITGTGITGNQLREFDEVQRANGLIIVHSDFAPMELKRGANDTIWTLSSITFDNIPLFAFALTTTAPSATLTPSSLSGNINLTASSGVFTSTDVGGYVTGNGGEARITKFVSATQVTARVILNFVDITAIASGSWELENGYSEAWSALRGYPRSVAYDNDSLIFGGTKSLPDVFWKSYIGSYFDFDDTKAVADGALTSSVRSDNINDIRFMVSGNDFIIFTSESEFYVDGELTPELNFQIRKQESRGCRQFIKPVFVDGAPMYIDGKADILRELTYSDAEAKYQSTNLNLFSPGLLKNPISIAHQKPRGQRDNDYVWIINEAGDWVVFNTLRKQDINGFTTGRSREDKLIAIKDLSGDLFAMFERTIDGGTEYYLERFDSTLKMDCCKIYSGAATTTISGLGHLENESVKVLVGDGFLHEDRVVTGGQITLNDSYTDVIVGFNFIPRIVTLPPSIPLPDGTSMGQIRRIIAVSLGLSDVGEFRVNQQPIKTRRFGQDIFDAPPPLLNGRKRVTLRGGYNRDPVIEIDQPEPLDFHVTDLILEVQI